MAFRVNFWQVYVKTKLVHTFTLFEAELQGITNILVSLSVPSPRLQTHKLPLQLWAFLSNQG